MKLQNKLKYHIITLVIEMIRESKFIHVNILFKSQFKRIGENFIYKHNK